MSLLRIYVSLNAGPPRCRWVVLEPGRNPVQGEGDLAQAPRGADRVQIIVPAAEVLLARTHLPQGAKRRANAVLAFAVEDETVNDPETQHAAWLGSAGDADVLAMVDKKGLANWLAALEAQGFKDCEVQCEILLLPRTAGEWSFAWNGQEGFVRTGDFEGGATDAGTPQTPPLSLRLMIESAAKSATAPSAVAVYSTSADATVDVAAWQRELGVAVRLAGPWDWRTARQDAGSNLLLKRRSWAVSSDLATRLRPAAWIAGAAIALHAVALVVDWSLLRREQTVLTRQMEARFRTAVPEAVAVVDPALQMRRKLAEARHGAGIADSGDFLPMIEKTAIALRELPAGSLRVAAYEQGRLSLELTGVDEAAARRIAARLKQGGNLDAAVVPSRGSFVITVRAS